MIIDTSQFRYAAGASLSQYPTRVRKLKGAQRQVATSVASLSELQELLWADNRQSVLLIFQEIARLQLRFPVPASGDGWVEDAIAQLENEDG